MADRVSDAELVERAMRGEKAAFEELVERHYAVVAAAAFHVLSNHDAAKDCAQDAFMEAAKTLDRLRDRNKFSPWIYGISRRKAIYVLRRQRQDGEALKVKTDESKSVIPARTPSEQASHQEKLDSISKSLGQLPDIYREILLLKYIDNRSHEDIAQLLDISLAAVDKRLMRGKEMLRESIRKWHTED
ncbi:MAG TPA: RNA polymerase sigma factor [Planctomycetota bacterium]